MASVLGTSSLRSTLTDWFGSRKNEEMAGFTDATPVARTDGDAESSADLTLLLENLVIPRLVAGCGGKAGSLPAVFHANSAATDTHAIAMTDVIELTRLSVNADAPAMLDFVERFLGMGHSVETLYVELLAPAARKLGDYWEDDSEDFVTVTMALWRIQEVLRELTVRVPPAPHARGGVRSALFAPMPGEQHSLGTLMVAECFERAGWITEALIEPSLAEITDKFAAYHYDLIGLTVSCDCSSAALAGLVTTIRTVSRNPQIKVMVGGRVINAKPELLDICGADGKANDATTAITLADQLVPVKAHCLEDLA